MKDSPIPENELEDIRNAVRLYKQGKMSEYWLAVEIPDTPDHARVVAQFMREES